MVKNAKKPRYGSKSEHALYVFLILDKDIKI